TTPKPNQCAATSYLVKVPSTKTVHSPWSPKPHQPHSSSKELPALARVLEHHTPKRSASSRRLRPRKSPKPRCVTSTPTTSTRQPKLLPVQPAPWASLSKANPKTSQNPW